MNARVHDYHDGNRHFQDRFDTRRVADHIGKRATETIGQDQKEFIERADMFFLATCDHRGGCRPVHTRAAIRGSCGCWTSTGLRSPTITAMGNINLWAIC